MKFIVDLAELWLIFNVAALIALVWKPLPAKMAADVCLKPDISSV